MSTRMQYCKREFAPRAYYWPFYFSTFIFVGFNSVMYDLQFILYFINGKHFSRLELRGHSRVKGTVLDNSVGEIRTKKNSMNYPWTQYSTHLVTSFFFFYFLAHAYGQLLKTELNIQVLGPAKPQFIMHGYNTDWIRWSRTAIDLIHYKSYLTSKSFIML